MVAGSAQAESVGPSCREGCTVRTLPHMLHQRLPMQPAPEPHLRGQASVRVPPKQQNGRDWAIQGLEAAALHGFVTPRLATEIHGVAQRGCMAFSVFAQWWISMTYSAETINLPVFLERSLMSTIAAAIPVRPWTASAVLCGSSGPSTTNCEGWEVFKRVCALADSGSGPSEACEWPELVSPDRMVGSFPLRRR